MVGTQIGPAGAQPVLLGPRHPQHHARSVHVLHPRIQSVQGDRRQQHAEHPFPAVLAKPQLGPGKAGRQQAPPAQRRLARRVGHRRPDHAQRDIRRRQRPQEKPRRNRPARRPGKPQGTGQHQGGPGQGQRQPGGIAPDTRGPHQPHAPGRRPHQQQQRHHIIDAFPRRRPTARSDPLPAILHGAAAHAAYHRLRCTSMMSSGSSRMSSSGVRSRRRALRMFLTILPPRLMTTRPLANSV